MWKDYADNEKGFVIAFDTTHPGFVRSLMPRGRLGKMIYSDEPVSSALSVILEHEGAGVMFRKLMQYSFEREWRIVRLLERLEHDKADIFVSPFDAASVSEIIIRPSCTIESDLRQLIQLDERFSHLQIVVQQSQMSALE
jgi:hypothetical protein